jgi:hypothetical protein
VNGSLSGGLSPAALWSFRREWIAEQLPSLIRRTLSSADITPAGIYAAFHLVSYVLTCDDHVLGTTATFEIDENIKVAIRMESAVSFAQRPCAPLFRVCLYLHGPRLAAVLVRDEQICSLALREVGETMNPRCDSSAAARYTPVVPVSCVCVAMTTPFRLSR